MATGIVSWSKTAGNNANADSTVSMPEGMPPSAVNDGVRALMASGAEYRDDTAGSIVTAGGSGVYTATSNQGFVSTTAMDGQEIAVRFNVGSPGRTSTLNVDGLGAFPITVDGVNSLQSTVVTGAIMRLTFKNSLSAWIAAGYAGAIGYATGVGGAVTQAGSIGTTVTINTICGAITTVSNAWTAGVTAVFHVNNSIIANGDVVAVSQNGTGSNGYLLAAVHVGTGGFDVGIYPFGTATEAVGINFAVIKAAAS